MKNSHVPSSTGEEDHLSAGSGSARSGLRLGRLTIAVVLILSLIAPACTPEQIEMSVDRIAISFEQGGVERGLFEAVLVVESAIPEIGMLIGYAIGP